MLALAARCRSPARDALPSPHPQRISHPMFPRLMIIAALALTPLTAPVRAAEGGELSRLAEILGALHYLRPICGANDGPRWRNEMQALVDAETPNGDRRARIVASFNRGYRGFQQAYHSCTPAADLAIRRYLEEGAKISREITARYAN